MTYQESIDFLYNSLPVFQREGASAYKPGLGTSVALDDLFGNPHREYACIHIAGTNGKGSTAHTLAAVLARAGYRTGLYTSPHIFDFRERIRVNGQKISHEAVVDFVERWMAVESDLTPSFFELTSTMAFEYFAREKVDVAVIETGLGGRLDSTNIITPVVSVITNISPDHTALLGESLEKIAFEKAGIIKTGVPAVIGERQPECMAVFEERAEAVGAPLKYAASLDGRREDGMMVYEHTPYGKIRGELSGDCQIRNAATVMETLGVLSGCGFAIPAESVRDGFAHVCKDTGLMGRWTTLRRDPLTICDTGHNIGGWEYIASQLSARKSGTLHLIMGFVNDKDISAILRKIAEIGGDKRLYFSAPSVPRGLNAEVLAAQAAEFGLNGPAIADVNEALATATAAATGTDDMILIAGSNFLIADLNLSLLSEDK